jgi:lipid-binding SYLF domain-containing protein
MQSLRWAIVFVAATFVCAALPSLAQDEGKEKASELASSSQKALSQLQAKVQLAKLLTPKAHAILVFPKVTKAGLMIGGQYGEGSLLKSGAATGYYKTTGASFGLQAGGQAFAYAMFFMNEKALASLDSANGFEVGVGPSIVVVDEGMAKTTTSKTLKEDVYAFIFGQKSLAPKMALLHDIPFVLYGENEAEYGNPIADTQSGFRVYPARLFALMRRDQFRWDGFVFESEVLIRAAHRGIRSIAVPIPGIYPKTARPSHFRPVADIARIVVMVAGQLLRRGFFPQGLWRSLGPAEFVRPERT